MKKEENETESKVMVEDVEVCIGEDKCFGANCSDFDLVADSLLVTDDYNRILLNFYTSMLKMAGFSIKHEEVERIEFNLDHREPDVVKLYVDYKNKTTHGWIISGISTCSPQIENSFIKKGK